MPLFATSPTTRRGVPRWAWGLLGVLALGVWGCSDEGEEAPGPVAGEDAGGGEEDGGGGADGGETPDGGAPSNNSAGGLSYEIDVLPIMERHACTVCHGPALQQGGHRLDTAELALTSGANAPAVVPCDAAGSPLVQKLRVATVPFGGLMPQGGPEIPDADVAVISQWINEGAGVQACGGGENNNPDVPEEVPPPVVEERIFRVSARVEMLTGRVSLEESGEGGSALFGVPGEAFYGVVGASGQAVRVGRRGELEALPPSWASDALVGEVLAAQELPDGELLISTQTGLLYLSDGQLWPSPVSSALEVPVTSMFGERVFDAEGRQGLWMATPRGLFVLVGSRLERLTPEGVRAETPVDAMALGRSPVQTEENATWVAYGRRLFAVRPDSDGAMVYRFELDFDGPIQQLTTVEGEVWATTASHVYHRRSGPLVGRSRWVSWPLPEGQQARGLVASADGAVWLLTDAVLYRTADQETWEVAVGAPTTDVVGMHAGDGAGIWLTRPREVTWVAPGPTVAVAGLKPHQSLSFFPDLEIFPAPAAGVEAVTLQVDTCPPVELTSAPWELRGGSESWSPCLGPGNHTLHAAVRYADGSTGTGAVAFAWESRSEPITWHAHVEPMIYAQYCARQGCHVDGFAPDSAATWQAKIDQVLERTDPATSSGRMPPNGPRLTEVERLLIRWWREDGFLP